MCVTCHMSDMSHTNVRCIDARIRSADCRGPNPKSRSLSVALELAHFCDPQIRTFPPPRFKHRCLFESYNVFLFLKLRLILLSFVTEADFAQCIWAHLFFVHEKRNLDLSVTLGQLPFQTEAYLENNTAVVIKPRAEYVVVLGGGEG